MCFIVIDAAIRFIRYVFGTIMFYLKSQYSIIMNSILNRVLMQTLSIQFIRSTR